MAERSEDNLQTRVTSQSTTQISLLSDLADCKLLKTNNGRDRARTDDPYRVEVVLFQLSYAPRVKRAYGF